MTPFRSAFLILCALALSTANADNWPQYRGPNRIGIVTERGLAQSWPEGGPKQLWSVKTGIGYSTPSAVDGKLYIFYLDDATKNDVLECLDAQSGKSLWKSSYDGGYAASFKGTRCTPVVEADRIYTYGGNSQLAAWNLADGKKIWMLNVLEATGGKNKQWGIASMPLIDGDVMYVQAGEGASAAVCVDKKTGKIIWKSQATGGGYATPVLADVQGAKILLCFGHETLVGMDPKDGKTLWTLDEQWEIEWHVNAAMPIVQGNQVFLTVAYKNGHCGVYEISASGIKQVWGNKAATCRFQAPILDNGYLYLNSEGTPKCIEWSTGKVMWSGPTDRGNHGGSLLRFGDKLILLSQRGKLTLALATPEKFEKISEVARAVEGNEVWSSPLIYQGKLYVKGKEDLVCYDIAGK